MPPAPRLARTPLLRAWGPRRLLAISLSLLLAGFLATFAADGGQLTWSMLADAIANCVAIVLTALPVWWLCYTVTWRLGTRSWFLPLHLIAAVAFSQLWHLALAVSLAAAALLSGGSWELRWLTGPALHWQLFTSVFLYVAVAAVTYAAQAAADAQAAAALQHQAEVAALRAQLDPHLLFNTLHSLLELVRSGDERADDAIERFARVTRYVSSKRTQHEDMVPLRAEWRMLEDYVALESLRLGSRLSCLLDLDERVAALHLPAMTVQPLVENAIRHGIAPRVGGGHVSVTARIVGDAVELLVEDNGAGLSAPSHGSGQGLSLVRRRLSMAFGTSVSMQAGPKADGVGWRVQLVFSTPDLSQPPHKPILEPKHNPPTDAAHLVLR